jgi:hypothetical protein
MMDINKISGTLAGQIAQKLDAADGKKDGKISASVWNAFVKDKGGEQIQGSISIASATSLITTYSNKAQDVQKGEDLVEKWLSGVKDVDTPKSILAELNKNHLPQNDTNPPQKVDISKRYLKDEYDEKGNPTKTVLVNLDGSVECIENEYDQNGNITKVVSRKGDGSVAYYSEYKYDENGNEIQQVSRFPDGSVQSYDEKEYDGNGNEVKWIHRDASRSGLLDYNEYEHNEKGLLVKSMYISPDGAEYDYTEYEYDQNGKRTKEVRKNPDGSIKE